MVPYNLTTSQYKLRQRKNASFAWRYISLLVVLYFQKKNQIREIWKEQARQKSAGMKGRARLEIDQKTSNSTHEKKLGRL